MAYNDYGPSAIVNAGARVCEAVGSPRNVSWCKGDANHTYGYHRGAAYLRQGQYSYNKARDVNGIDPMACSALDLGVGSANTIKITIAHRQLWQAGKLPSNVAEFGGTLDGRVTYAREAIRN